MPAPAHKTAPPALFNLVKDTPLVILLVLAVGVGPVSAAFPAMGAPDGSQAGPGSSHPRRTYSTRFLRTEDPISEGGNWECGKSVGLDWADVATAPGLAYGLESGAGGFDDSTALLTGTWGPDQTAQATVRRAGQGDEVGAEVELRLRSSLSAHSATGYEINFRCAKSKDAYVEIVRWNGPLGNFSYLVHNQGAQFGVSDGDIVKATMFGNVITVFLNGLRVAQATDDTYATGRPGIGFYLRGSVGTGVNRNYGFSSFTATEGR